MRRGVEGVGGEDDGGGWGVWGGCCIGERLMEMVDGWGWEGQGGCEMMRGFGVLASRLGKEPGDEDARWRKGLGYWPQGRARDSSTSILVGLNPGPLASSPRCGLQPSTVRTSEDPVEA